MDCYYTFDNPSPSEVLPVFLPAVIAASVGSVLVIAIVVRAT
ncbi:MAG: hypothetical protein ACTSUU_02605 [Candidatus Thorarchaeota archaeon]